ncbi:exported hypothetical protein [Rhizobium sp. EC-SD404]|nr:exported hypothetical protein [Rhizobium sp. EC-SD404]
MTKDFRWILLALCAGLAACTSSDPNAPNYNPSFAAINDTLNKPAPRMPAPFVEAGTRRSGVFPTFANPPARSTVQMTELQREMQRAELAAALAEQRNDRSSASRYRARVAELQALARNHGPDQLARIEN